MAPLKTNRSFKSSKSVRHTRRANIKNYRKLLPLKKSQLKMSPGNVLQLRLEKDKQRLYSAYDQFSCDQLQASGYYVSTGSLYVNTESFNRPWSGSSRCCSTLETCSDVSSETIVTYSQGAIHETIEECNSACTSAFSAGTYIYDADNEEQPEEYLKCLPASSVSTLCYSPAKETPEENSMNATLAHGSTCCLPSNTNSVVNITENLNQNINYEESGKLRFFCGYVCLLFLLALIWFVIGR